MIELRHVALAGALLLAACNNQVITDKPLFTKVDAVGAPRIRAGIWNIASQNCGFDEQKPQNVWPKCANPFPPIPDPPPWLAVAGRPAIIQSNAPKGLSEPSTASAYLAFRAIKTNPARQATKIQVWFVQCGPPPAADESGLTKHLVLGLMPRKDSNNYTAPTKAALRRAAHASQAWMGGPAPIMHWVRDPIPGDLPPDNNP
ncbi:MAG TPA: hypothetical protein VG227_10295 [Caulobacteraceae bacterium]|nr:hypothetical protein [Caulobacteraceae bacterium]